MDSGDFGRASLKGQPEAARSDWWKAEIHQVEEGFGLWSPIRIPGQPTGRTDLGRPRNNGGHMVRKPPSRSGPESDLRSPPEDRSDRERPTDQSDTRLPRPGSGQPSLSDSTTESLRRLWAAVMVRALRDYSSTHIPTSNSVHRWVRSPGFDVVCEWAGIDGVRMRTVFDSLSLLPVDVRRSLVRQISISSEAPRIRGPRKTKTRSPSKGRPGQEVDPQ